jgi:hypothetical protein
MLLVVGIAFNALYWFLLDPAGINLPLKLVVAIGVFIHGFGLLTLVYAWLNRGLWVLVYPTGLFIWKRGVVTAFPWEEISSISFAGVRRFSPVMIERDESARIQTAWLPVEESITFWYWKLRIRRVDGAVAEVTELMAGSEELSRMIQERTFRLLWPPVWEQIMKGDDCSFGPFRVSRAGLTDDREELVRWDQIRSIRTDWTVQIRKTGRWRPWRTARISRIHNPHIFLALTSTSSEWRD